MKLSIFIVAKNKKIDVEMNENDYIFKIKEKVKENYDESIEISQIKLIYAGRVVENSKKINEIKMKDNSTVHCVITKNNNPEPVPVNNNPVLGNNSSLDNPMSQILNNPILYQPIIRPWITQCRKY